MKIDEPEAEALRLDPQGRARLAGRLLESLDELSPAENTRIWAEEAERRAAALERAGLGAAFIAEVQRCTTEIVASPHSGSVTVGANPSSPVSALSVRVAVLGKRSRDPDPQGHASSPAPGLQGRAALIQRRTMHSDRHRRE